MVPEMFSMSVSHQRQEDADGKAMALDVLERWLSQCNKQNQDVCAIGLYKICSFNPLSSLSFPAA